MQLPFSHAIRAERPAAEATRFGALATLAARVDPLFLFLLGVGVILRLLDVNWDQSTHIHPDERFLTMLGTAIQMPHSLVQYFDPTTSPMAPYNNSVGKFMVYGMLPIDLNKVIAVVLGNDNYNNFVLQGRVLAALADSAVLILVFASARLLERKGLPPQVKYWALALYAVTVFPIQLAHFFATDAFLNAFMFGSFYFSLRYALCRGDGNLIAAAVIFGFAVATKVNAVYILPLDIYLILLPLVPAADHDLLRVVRTVRAESRPDLGRLALRAIGVVLTFGIVSYLALRLGDPYMFQSANPIDPRLNINFYSSLKQLEGMYGPSPYYPPAIQWMNKPPLVFALINMAVFGLGIPYFLLVVAGGYVLWHRRQGGILAVCLLWTVAFFLYQSTSWDKTMRYFIFLYPFLAVFAGIGAYALLRSLPYLARVAIVATLLVWPLAFLSIYLHPLSRVTASEWMYANLPNNSTILCEEWDDCLPLGVPNPAGKTFNTVTIHSFYYPDDATKWQALNAALNQGNYLVLSSNRGWGSMPTAPQDFPRMTAFYHDLFAGKTSYRLVAEFTSYPSLRWLGIPIDFPDQWSEEAFTVYDHPEVMIFEHIR